MEYSVALYILAARNDYMMADLFDADLSPRMSRCAEFENAFCSTLIMSSLSSFLFKTASTSADAELDGIFGASVRECQVAGLCFAQEVLQAGSSKSLVAPSPADGKHADDATISKKSKRSDSHKTRTAILKKAVVRGLALLTFYH